MSRELDKLIEDFKQLHTIDKKKIMKKEIYNQLFMLTKFNEYYGNKIYFNENFLDFLNKENISDNEYLEFLFEYMNIINRLLENVTDNSFLNK